MTQNVIEDIKNRTETLVHTVGSRFSYWCLVHFYTNCQRNALIAKSLTWKTKYLAAS